MEAIRAQVEAQDSLAHITQAEAEAVRLFDAAISRIEEFNHERDENNEKEKNGKEGVIFRRQRIVRPAEIVGTAYIETEEDALRFLDELRRTLEEAISNNERVQIR